MDIKAIQERQVEVQGKIDALLNDFVRETGMEVTYLDLGNYPQPRSQSGQYEKGREGVFKTQLHLSVPTQP